MKKVEERIKEIAIELKGDLYKVDSLVDYRCGMYEVYKEYIQMPIDDESAEEIKKDIEEVKDIIDVFGDGSANDHELGKLEALYTILREKRYCEILEKVNKELGMKFFHVYFASRKTKELRSEVDEGINVVIECINDCIFKIYTEIENEKYFEFTLSRDLLEIGIREIIKITKEWC